MFQWDVGYGLMKNEDEVIYMDLEIHKEKLSIVFGAELRWDK